MHKSVADRLKIKHVCCGHFNNLEWVSFPSIGNEIHPFRRVLRFAFSIMPKSLSESIKLCPETKNFWVTDSNIPVCTKYIHREIMAVFLFCPPQESVQITKCFLPSETRGKPARRQDPI